MASGQSRDGHGRRPGGYGLAAFTSLEAVETGYDANSRPVTSKLVANAATHALTHVSYDAIGRPECQAQRMNPAAFASLPASACSPGSEASFGPDRITKTIRDAAGQVTEVRTAVGTAEEAAEAKATYTANGQVQTLTDGEGNKDDLRNMTASADWQRPSIPPLPPRAPATRVIMSSSAMMRPPM
jgi:Sec-independent protein translocase protein TatA